MFVLTGKILFAFCIVLTDTYNLDTEHFKIFRIENAGGSLFGYTLATRHGRDLPTRYKSTRAKIKVLPIAITNNLHTKLPSGISWFQ